VTKKIERPILFSAPMVRAILEGRKSQTRRVAHESYRNIFEASSLANGYVALNVFAGEIHSPYGNPGDRLWVRETFYIDRGYCIIRPLPRERPAGIDDCIYYRADGECCEQIPECCCGELGPTPWRPSIHMPRWASRITLEVVGVRVERLREITEQDAISEGMLTLGPSSRERFEKFWDSINAKRGLEWGANPWVWVIEFKKIS
jgi:hypothetical protein